MDFTVQVCFRHKDYEHVWVEVGRPIRNQSGRKNYGGTEVMGKQVDETEGFQKSKNQWEFLVDQVEEKSAESRL